MSKFSWRYIVIRHRDKSELGGKYYYQIHEGYGFKDGIPAWWTVDAIAPLGKSVAELQNDLNMMLQDIYLKGVFEVKGKKLVRVK